MGSANERHCYNVTLSLISWAHSQSDSCCGVDTDNVFFLFQDTLLWIRSDIMGFTIHITLALVCIRHSNAEIVIGKSRQIYLLILLQPFHVKCSFADSDFMLSPGQGQDSLKF